MKYLLSLMLTTTFVCETVYHSLFVEVVRCENKEVICYIYSSKSGISCKFKEQEQ